MKKGQTSIKTSNNSNFQYQSFAHLLYRQGKREDQKSNDINNSSPFKQHNYYQNEMNIQGNTNTVSVSSFQNEDISYANQNIIN